MSGRSAHEGKRTNIVVPSTHRSGSGTTKLSHICPADQRCTSIASASVSPTGGAGPRFSVCATVALACTLSWQSPHVFAIVASDLATTASSPLSAIATASARTMSSGSSQPRGKEASGPNDSASAAASDFSASVSPRQACARRISVAPRSACICATTSGSASAGSPSARVWGGALGLQSERTGPAGLHATNSKRTSSRLRGTYRSCAHRKVQARQELRPLADYS